jgi:hypothetical protein
VVSLKPEDVDCIVFWTKNPASFLDKIPLLEPYLFYFLFTITPYGPDLEPALPAKDELIRIFCRLSDRIGKERVVWRYDPVLCSPLLDVDFHMGAFSKMAASLHNHTSKCIISFLTLYRKILPRLEPLHIVVPDDTGKEQIAASFIRIAGDFGLELVSCAMEKQPGETLIHPNRCIDNVLISRITGKEIPFKKDKGQRIACGCHESIDIGSYNTCRHGCLYCYAGR